MTHVLVSAAIIGAVTGALVGTIGIGAGVLMVPSLMYFSGLTMQSAVGITVAMQALPVGIGGAYVYYRKGLLDLRLVVVVSTGMLIGIGIGAMLSTKGVTSGSINGDRLQTFLGIVLVLMGAFMIVKTYRKVGSS